MIILTILAVLLVIYGITTITVYYVSGKETKLPFRWASLIVGVFMLFISSIIVAVDAQDVGVVTSPSGVVDEELHTGWHIVSPLNDVHYMDKTVWVYTCSNTKNEGQKADADAIWSPTKDGIKVGMDVSVSWKIIPNEASWIYQNVSENDGGVSSRYYWLEENVIRPKLKSALALTVSEYTPIEVYSTKREEIQNRTIKRMRDAVKEYKIVIDQVDLREVFYNGEYEKAINAKKLAEQEVLRLVEVTRQKEEQLKQASINKNIAIQQAEGEAKALQIKGNSISQNAKIIDLEWISKWDGQLPTYMMGSGQGVMINLNK
jgi:regulator of protease activity HflC (stomatin/prohibitin superfamily)